MPPIRVLIVDDSVVIRKLLCDALSSSPEVAVAGTASSGALALAKVPQLNPDVITLDIDNSGFRIAFRERGRADRRAHRKP